MSSCLIINSPKTGEIIESNLFSELNKFDSTNANDYFMHTLSEEYVSKYGNWGDGTFMLETDSHGEPVFNNSFVRTLTDFEKPKAELREKLIRFLDGMGFSYERVSNILTEGGQSVSGVTDFLLKTVKVVEGASPRTLAEEAAHVYVEWLEQQGSPLFTSMYQDVKNTQTYNEVLEEYSELYNNDEVALTKEAMGKLLAKIIFEKYNNNENATVTNRVKGWWGRVKSFLGNLIGVSYDQLSSFLDAADDMMSMEGGVLNAKNYKLYDASLPANAQKALNTLIENNNNIELKEVTVDGERKSRYFINGTEILNRVSDIIRKINEKIYGKEYIEAQELNYTINRETGTLGHADVENIVNRFIQATNGETQDAVTNNLKLSPDIHLKLTQAVTSILSQYPPNSKIFTEVKIYDKKRNIAGTIDLLIVEPSGKVNMFDWKFIDAAKEGRITSTKRNNWTRQLNEYRAILETYGFKDFGKMRMIPIQTKYSEDGTRFEGIIIDNIEIEAQSVPSKAERTGKADLDRLLNNLQRELEIVIGTRVTSEGDKIKRNILLSQLNDAIADIQIFESLDGFLNIANKRIDNIKNRLAASDFNSEEELKDIINDLKYYEAIRSLKKYDLVEDDKGNVVQGDNIITLSDNANELLDIANEKLIEYLNNKSLSIDALRPVTFLDRVAVLGVHKNPIFQYFNRLRTQKEDEIDREQRIFNNEIKELQSQLEKEETTDNKYDKILKKDESGKYTGNFIDTYRREFWNTIQDASIDWVKNNTKFKEGAEEQYKEDLETLIADKYSYVRKDVTGAYDREGAARADREIEAFKYKYDFWSPKYRNKAYENYKNTRRSRYISPDDSWYSDEYRYILDNKDKAISKLYFKFQSVIERSREYSTSYIPNSFIPSIEKSFIKKLMDSRSTKGIVSDVMDNLTTPPYERAVDENGNPIYKIPLKYTTNLKADKNLDLGVVFSLFNHSVLQNEYLGQIENETLLLEMALQAGNYVKTDFKGNIVKKDELPEYLPENSLEKAETVKQFREHVNKIIYQISNETKEVELGAGISANRLVDKAIQLFSLQKIGLSPVTGISNLLGGNVMLYSMASRTKHFDVKDVAKAQQQLVMRNPNALAAIEYFDVLTSNTTFKKSKELSMSKLEKTFSVDNMYVMMESGEKIVQYSALLAYLNANTIDENGLPIKKTDPAQKSILEMFDTDAKGNINIKGLSEDGFNIVRKRSRGFAAEVLGSLSERDLLLIQKSLLGRALLQFKRWMLPMGRLRFGTLTYNDNLDEFEEGKLRRVFVDLIDKRVISLTASMTQAMFLGRPNQTLQEKIEEVYNSHIAKNPEFADKLSLEQYTELYIKNLRSTAFDIGIIGSVILLINGLKGEDDDEELTKTQKFMNIALAKGLTELTFWFDPQSFMKLLTKNAIPVVGLLDEVRDLIVESSKFALSGGDTGKPWDKAKRLVPGVNQVERIEKLLK